MHGQSAKSRIHGQASKFVLILLGFGLTAGLVLSADTQALWRDFSAVDAGLTIILALLVVVMTIDGAAWRTLLPPSDAGTLRLLLWARWVRESTNLLLPVAPTPRPVRSSSFQSDSVRIRASSSGASSMTMCPAATS